jgi:hypothetical protein
MVVAGEITTPALLDIADIARTTIDRHRTTPGSEEEASFLLAASTSPNRPGLAIRGTWGSVTA